MDLTEIKAGAERQRTYAGRSAMLDFDRDAFAKILDNVKGSVKGDASSADAGKIVNERQVAKPEAKDSPKDSSAAKSDRRPAKNSQAERDNSKTDETRTPNEENRAAPQDKSDRSHKSDTETSEKPVTKSADKPSKKQENDVTAVAPTQVQPDTTKLQTVPEAATIAVDGAETANISPVQGDNATLETPATAPANVMPKDAVAAAGTAPIENNNLPPDAAQNQTSADQTAVLKTSPEQHNDPAALGHASANGKMAKPQIAGHEAETDKTNKIKDDFAALLAKVSGTKDKKVIPTSKDSEETAETNPLAAKISSLVNRDDTVEVSLDKPQSAANNIKKDGGMHFTFNNIKPIEAAPDENYSPGFNLFAKGFSEGDTEFVPTAITEGSLENAATTPDEMTPFMPFMGGTQQTSSDTIRTDFPKDITINGLKSPSNVNNDAGVKEASVPKVRVLSQEIMEQIKVGVAKVSKTDLPDKITINLRPKEMGIIEVKLEVGKDGKVSAVINASKPETAQALQRDVAALAKSFTDAGFDASANSFSFNSRGEQGDGRHDNESGSAFARNISEANETTPVTDEQSIEYVTASGVNIRV